MKCFVAAGAYLALAPFAAGAQERPIFDKAQFRLDLSQHLPQGQAALELVSSNARGTNVRLEVDEGVRVQFRDDGGGIDARRNDGVFTAAVPADLNRERQTMLRLVDGLRRGVDIPVFEGRHLLRKVNSRKLIPKFHANVLPIIGTSANTTVNPDKSLFITDPSVFGNTTHSFNPCDGTGNPNGSWAFGHVMTELAGDINPSDFAIDWISHWQSDQVVNEFTAPDRPTTAQRILDVWDQDNNGILEMEHAPFHPIAITLRIDLRNGAGYGSGHAGEARIVYSFVDENCTVNEPMLVIFEYAIRRSGCSIKAWGEDWADLSTMSLGSTQYADALADLTRQFTDLTTSPNSNRLGQLRTNERIQSPWELREFHMTDTGFLSMDTIKLTPDLSFNSTPLLGSLMVEPEDQDEALFDSMLGAAVTVPFPPAAEFWESSTALSNDLRHEFSVNTCNACHGGETGTFFTHVEQTVPGATPVLSDFLLGNPGFTAPNPMFDGFFEFADPVVPATKRYFADIERRRQDLQDLVDASCLHQITEVPVTFKH